MDYLKLWKENPKRAFDTFCKEFKKVDNRDIIFIWTSSCGIDGKEYGSYKNIALEELKKRKYLIVLNNNRPALFFIDRIYNPKERKYIELNWWKGVKNACLKETESFEDLERLLKIEREKYMKIEKEIQSKIAKILN